MFLVIQIISGGAMSDKGTGGSLVSCLSIYEFVVRNSQQALPLLCLQLIENSGNSAAGFWMGGSEYR